MKKTLVYILILLIGHNSCGIGEVLKLPVLCQHFMEHKQVNNEISIKQYLSMHYWGNDAVDNDDKRDMQLPFKNVIGNTIQSVFLTQNNFIAINFFSPLVTQKSIAYKKDLYSWFYNNSLIKPPSLKA